mgnify:FL=1
MGRRDSSKTAKAVGEMLLITEASDPFLQDIYEAPLGAVEKTETHSGAASGSYRMITDLSCSRNGRASANDITDASKSPPTVCPTH